MTMSKSDRRRELKRKQMAQAVTMRLNKVKYPPGTMVKDPQRREGKWGIVTAVDTKLAPQYTLRFETGPDVYCGPGVIDLIHASRSQYKLELRRRRKAGEQVKSLI